MCRSFFCSFLIVNLHISKSGLIKPDLLVCKVTLFNKFQAMPKKKHFCVGELPSGLRRTKSSLKDVLSGLRRTKSSLKDVLFATSHKNWEHETKFLISLSNISICLRHYNATLGVSNLWLAWLLAKFSCTFKKWSAWDASMKVFIRRFKSEDVTLGSVSIQILVMSVVQEWNKIEETCCLPEIHFFAENKRNRSITKSISLVWYHQLFTTDNDNEKHRCYN